MSENFNQAMDEYMDSGAPEKPKVEVLIKRYPNRKLYDTNESKYVTLSDIKELVKEGHNVWVVDNKTKEDLTAVTLLQIMFEDQKQKVVSGDVSAPSVSTLLQAVRLG